MVLADFCRTGALKLCDLNLTDEGNVAFGTVLLTKRFDIFLCLYFNNELLCVSRDKSYSFL